jgi:hypothetical protein
MGASLSYLNDAFEPFDYQLVCCNIPGANAFFVQTDTATASRSTLSNSSICHRDTTFLRCGRSRGVIRAATSA